MDERASLAVDYHQGLVVVKRDERMVLAMGNYQEPAMGTGDEKSSHVDAAQYSEKPRQRRSGLQQSDLLLPELQMSLKPASPMARDSVDS